MKEDEKPPVEDVKKESSEVSSQQPAAENMVDEKKPDGQGADDGSFTSGARLVVIMVAVLMSLFLVALVSLVYQMCQYMMQLLTAAGSDYHCDCGA